MQVFWAFEKHELLGRKEVFRGLWTTLDVLVELI